MRVGHFLINSQTCTNLLSPFSYHSSLIDGGVQVLQPRLHHPVVAGLLLHPLRHPPRPQLQDHQGLPREEEQQLPQEEKDTKEEEEEKSENLFQPGSHRSHAIFDATNICIPPKSRRNPPSSFSGSRETEAAAAERGRRTTNSRRLSAAVAARSSRACPGADYGRHRTFITMTSYSHMKFHTSMATPSMVKARRRSRLEAVQILTH